MNTRVFVILTSICIVLSGCSTISKSECLATDWQQIGLEDGKKGLGAFTNSSYQESCAKHNVEIDLIAYRQGHEQGVALFCQPENGFDLGKQAYQYTVMCPPDFIGEYEIGYKFFLAYKNIDQVEQALNTNASTISKLEAGLNTAYLRLNNDDLSISEENQLRQNIDSMSGQIEGYELSTERLIPLLGQRQQELENLKAFYNR